MVALALGLLSIFTAAASATPVLKFKETFGSAAQPNFTEPVGLAVDQASGDLLVMDRGSETISRFKPDGSPDSFSALGTNVIGGTSGPNPEGFSFHFRGEGQIAVDNSGKFTDGDIYVTTGTSVAIFARSGEYLGSISSTNEPQGVTVDPAGNVYVGYFTETRGVEKFTPTANPPTSADRVANFREQGRSTSNLSAGIGASAGALFALESFGGLRKLSATTGKLGYLVFEGSGSVSTAVEPSSGGVLVAAGTEVIEYDASDSSRAIELSRLSAPAPVSGLATGPAGLIYVVSENGVEVWDHVPTPTATLATPTEISATGVTFNGTVNPEGLAVSECKFEYGPVTSAGFTQSLPCTPAAGTLPSDSADHAVAASASGLQLGTRYRFRLVAANVNGANATPVGTLTLGSPAFSEVRATDATQDSATIEATVDPRGFATSYHIDWGLTTAYGHRIPMDIEGNGGDGLTPVHVSGVLAGLSPGTSYHYRIVANNANGPSETTDRELETLDSCELPDLRCLELVSPREVGPVAMPGTTSNEELDFQAATQPGSIAFSVANGLPGTTKAAEVLYRAIRGPEGWTSTQLSPPILDRNETSSPASLTALTLGIPDDLSCGVIVSNQLLTSEPGTRLAVESGGVNLYRRNSDGSYAAITNLPPESFEEQPGALTGDFQVYGVSKDCGTVIFGTQVYRYPGLAAQRGPVASGGAQQYIYEWHEGTLRSVGLIPAAAGGEAAVPIIMGGLSEVSGPQLQNVVSSDGHRVFFSAKREESMNGEEIGKVGVFVRENGATRDLSRSDTSTPDERADYQYATPSGSKVYFLANAGLTTEASPAGQDLYEYDLGANKLTDLSVTSAVGGAQVGGVLGASADGSYVYFAAKGQLVPGAGPTLEENEEANTYSIYEAVAGTFKFAGIMKAEDLAAKDTSRVSADGRFLLYQSRAGVIGYVSGGPKEAYLYDSTDTDEPIACVSCRQDAQPSATPRTNFPLGNGDRQNPLHGRMRLVVSGGRALVYFTSHDDLATGGVEGVENLYEWSHDQVFHIANEPPGIQPPESAEGRIQEYLKFAGASSDGTDLYFTTPGALTWEDAGDRNSVYDARVGGGFQQPTAGAAPCSPTAEGSCQGTSSEPPSTSAPGTSGFTGPGNKKPACKKTFVRRHGKCVKKHAKQKKHKKQGHKKTKKHGHKNNNHRQKGHKRAARHANTDGGAVR